MFYKLQLLPQFKIKLRLYRTLKMEIFASDTGEWIKSEFSCQKHVFASDWLLENAFVCNGVPHCSDVYLNTIFAFDRTKSMSIKPQITQTQIIDAMIGSAFISWRNAGVVSGTPSSTVVISEFEKSRIIVLVNGTWYISSIVVK